MRPSSRPWGVKERTAYNYLDELQEHSYIAGLGGLIRITGFPRPRRGLASSRGKRRATFDEALPVVRAVMKLLYPRRNRVSAKHRILAEVNRRLAVSSTEISMYGLDKCLRALAASGEFCLINPAKPFKTVRPDGTERWESEPAERGPGTCAAPPSRPRRRPGYRALDQWRRLTSCHHWPTDMMQPV